MSKFYVIVFLWLASAMAGQTLQPQCNSTLYSLNNNTLQYCGTSAPLITTQATISLPASSSGLAIGHSLGFSAPAITFWTYSNGSFWYFNGSVFINTSHGIGTSTLSNIAGGGTVLYGYDQASGLIYKYNGSANATSLIAVPGHTNNGILEDIAADENDNFYLVDLQLQSLLMFNSLGTSVCSYSLVGIPSNTNVSGAFAITGNTVYVQNNGSLYEGLISGALISFTTISNTLGACDDFASCPLSNTFTSSVSSSLGSCLNGQLTLTATSALSALSYTWSGPGIITSVSNQTIIVNLPGVYTCSLQSTGCIPKNSFASYTVYASPVLTVAAGSSSLCSGNSTTLSVSGAVNYTWQPMGALGNSVSLMPLTTQIYTVSGENANACISYTTIQVSVTPTPTLSTLATPSVLCLGQSSTFTATGAASYTWLPGFIQSPSLALTPTTTNFSVLGANGSCTAASVFSIVINQNPTVVVTVSQPSICSGNITNLNASGADSYLWQPGTLSGSAVSVSPLANTVYTVTGNYTATGCSDTKTITISVTPTPTLSTFMSNTVSCAGNSIAIGASGAANYTWMPGSIATASTTVSPAISTTYTLSGANATCVSTKTIFLLVNPNPTLSASPTVTTICSGLSAALSASGATSYTWIPGANTGSNILAAPLITTIYTVTGADPNNCVSTKTVQIGVSPSPTLYPAATPTGVCYGGTVSLSASGIYVATSTVYWNPYVSANGVITPMATGIYTVYAQSSPFGFFCTASATVLVTVYSTSNVVASPNSSLYCNGASISLSALGANNYTWNPGGMNGSTIAVSPTLSTTYTVTGDNTSTGCSNTSTVYVGILPTPVLTVAASQYTVCNGNSSNLYATGANNYTWTSPAQGFNNSTSVSPSITTVYTVQGVNSVGCTSNGTVQVTVHITPTLSITAPTTQICNGSTLNINAVGASAYTWQPGTMLTTSVNVNPSSSTVYTVTGVNGICSSSSSIAISVNQNPTVTINGPGQLCSGNSATLTALGATSFLWLSSGNPTSIEFISPASTAIYTVVGSFSTGCSSTQTLSVQVNTTPTVSINASNPIICSGESSTLTAVGAAGYNWNPGSLTGALVVVSPQVNTTYTLTGSNNLCIDTETITLNVNPTPSINILASSYTVCSGNTLTLTSGGASSYTWHPGNQNGNSISVSPSTSIVYTVVGSNTFCVGANTVAIEVNTFSIIPVSSNTLLCSGETATISAPGANNYSWNTGELTPSIIVSPTVTTSYTVTGVDINNCESTVVIQQNVSDCVGLEESVNTSTDMVVYPNPNNGDFNIKLSNFSENTEIEIYSSLGELILKKKAIDLILSIHLENATNGIYLLLIKDGAMLVTNLKIIRQ